MKNKPFKKVLSVFLAALMLMTCWVFVEPEHAHATSASTISSTNQTAISALNSGNTDVTTVYGSFQYDDSYVEASHYASVYKNVLYSDPKPVSSVAVSSAKTQYGSSWTGSNGVTIHWYHPTTTLMYDGETTPSLGVMVYPEMYYTGTWSRKSRNQSFYITSASANGLAFTGCWHGPDSRLNFQYTWFNKGNAVWDKEGETSKTYVYEGTGSATLYFANILYFTGSMSDTEYVRTITPVFGFIGNNGDDGATITATSGRKIYVINYKPLKAAINEAINVYIEIAKNPAKYTTASVAKYVELGKALLAAKPNNYVNSTTNNPSGYATAAKAAVDAWKAWSGLEVQKYTLTYNNYKGEAMKSYTYDYGTAVDCASLAPANSVTEISGNDNNHQLYQWDSDTFITTLIDDVTLTEITAGTASHSYGDVSYSDTSYHKSTCSACGHTKYVAHTSDGGKITTASTCTATGVKTYTCTVAGCEGLIKTETVPALGHSFTSGTYKENETGKDGNHYQKCARCDVYGMGTTAGKTENHSWDNGSVTTPAECEKTGVRTYTCTICPATYTEEIPATEHLNVTSVDAVPNGCGIQGNYAYRICADCGKVWADINKDGTEEEYTNTDADNDGTPDAVEIAAIPHDFTGDAKSQSTGLDGTHNFLCKNCGKAYGIMENGNPVTDGTEQHDFDKNVDGSVTDADAVIKEASCTDEGSKTYTCQVCKQTYVEKIEKTAHSMTKKEASEASCGVAGNKEYYYCSICQKYYKDEAGTQETTVEAETIPALNHTWTQHHDYDTLNTEATCQSRAIYNNHCDYCKTKLTGTHPYGEADPINGHNFAGEAKNNDNGTHSYKCTVVGCDKYGYNGAVDATEECASCDEKYVETEHVDSTCCERGYTTYECLICHTGYTVHEKNYDSSNHSGKTEVRDSVTATCKTPGYTGDTYCLGCGNKIKDGTVTGLNSTNHDDLVVVPYKASTCQVVGNKEYYHCSACNKDYTDEAGTIETTAKEQVIAMKDHVLGKPVSDGDGIHHTATCATCKEEDGEVYKVQSECSGGEATCAAKAICDKCKEAYGSLNSSNHKHKSKQPKVDSTCQTEGYEEYMLCTDCGKPAEEIKVISKKEHTFTTYISNGDGTHTAECDTCVVDEEKGLTKATDKKDCSGGTAYCNAQAVCEVCKVAYGSLNPTNHKLTGTKVVNAVDATCTEKGYTGDTVHLCCYVDGMEYTADSPVVVSMGEETDALEHDFSVEVEGTRVDSTCCTKGSVEMKCSRCDATEVQTLELNQKKHEKGDDGEYVTVTIGANAGNCVEDGYTGDIYCAKCYKDEEGADNSKALLYKGKTITSSGKHDFDIDDDGIDDAVADGRGRHDDNYWYHVYTCEVCGEEVTERCYTYPEHQYNCVETDKCQICGGQCSLTAPSIHKGGLKKVEAVASTCQAEGTKEYYVCADGCGKKYYDAAGTEEVKSDADLVVAKAAHAVDWSNGTVIKEASCGENGTTRYFCTTPGCTYYVDKDDISSSGVHSWSTDYKVTTEPTCHSTGYKALYCTVCGKLKSGTYLVVPMTEHSWDDGVVTSEATCTKDGVKTYTCQNDGCGATKTETLPATSHSENGVWEVKTAATCTKAGVEIMRCSKCLEEIKSREIKMLDHNYDENASTTVIVKEPTCCKEGQKKVYCTTCNATVIIAIPATGKHNYVTVPGKDPTCSQPGYTESEVCSDCGAVNPDKTAQEIAPNPDNHHDYDGDGYCDGCGHDYLSGKCNCICHKEFWLMRIIYKILRFFWKLFGISRTCRCGITHY